MGAGLLPERLAGQSGFAEQEARPVSMTPGHSGAALISLFGTDFP